LVDALREWYFSDVFSMFDVLFFFFDVQFDV
jgi:hypothetical protein